MEPVQRPPSRSITDVSAWDNCRVIDRDLLATVKEQARDRDVVVAGSASVVHAPAKADLVDEYRILLFPTALGTGSRAVICSDGKSGRHLFALVWGGQRGSRATLRPVRYPIRSGTRSFRPAEKR